MVDRGVTEVQSGIAALETAMGIHRRFLSVLRQDKNMVDKNIFLSSMFLSRNRTLDESPQFSIESFHK